jgi:hypothetical protein
LDNTLMPVTYPRFTIRSLMVTVAVAAGVCALYRLTGGLGLVLVWLGLLYFGEIGIFWWMFRGFRRLSALCMGITSGLANIICCLVCVYVPRVDYLMPLIWLMSLPVVLGAGSAWAVTATRRNAYRRRSPWIAWPLMIGIAVAPLTMVFTLWPLRIAYWISRPAMERLADQIAAGRILPHPEWAGVIHVAGSAVDPAKGNLALIVAADYAGRSAFVRVSPRVSPEQDDAPLYNRSLNERLGGRWSFQRED